MPGTDRRPRTAGRRLRRPRSDSTSFADRWAAPNRALSRPSPATSRYAALEASVSMRLSLKRINHDIPRARMCQGWAITPHQFALILLTRGFTRCTLIEAVYG